MMQFVPVYFVLIGLSFGAAYVAWQWTRKLKTAETVRAPAPRLER